MAGAFLLGVASNLRPEVHLLFLLALMNRVLSVREVSPGKYRISWAGKCGHLLGALGIYLLLQLPYTLFCLLHHGRLFPTTYYSQQLASGLIVWPYLGDFVTWLVLTLGPLFLFCLVGVTVALRRSVASAEGRSMLLPALWLFVFPVAQAMKNPAMVNHGRYLMPFIPLWTLLALIGMKACFDLVRDKRWELGWRGRALTLQKAKEILLGLVILLLHPLLWGLGLCGAEGAPGGLWLDGRVDQHGPVHSGETSF